MSEEKICPIMARGWLSNRYSAFSTSSSDRDNTFKYERLPKCLKEKCAWWVPDALNPGGGKCSMEKQHG